MDGVGRVPGIDPDAAERRAREHGAGVLAGTRVAAGHGWSDVQLEEPDRYTFAVGVALP